MSDKKRRDITLGEMQDECKKYWNNGNLGSCGKCQYMSICCHYEDYAPAKLNLTDPPRFTEAQMALLKGFMAIGAVSVQEVSGWFAVLDKDGKQINIARALSLCGETIDLTEVPMEDKE